MLNLHFSVFKHGKGLWKYNNALLKEPQYIEMINNHIKEIKRQYTVPIYVQRIINEIPDSEIQFMVNDQSFLETLLIEIRAKTISFGSYVKKKNTSKAKKLIQEIARLEENYDFNLETLEEKKKIRVNKLIGNLIRSRAKWINEGEKPTIYFINLENRNFTKKVIPKLTRIEKNKHIEITEQTEILPQVENFYKTLYTPQSLSEENIDLHAFLKDYNVPKVNSNDSVHLQGKMLYSEALSVLKNMTNNKSPGSDGFTAKNFKVFLEKFRSFYCSFIKSWIRNW